MKGRQRFRLPRLLPAGDYIVSIAETTPVTARPFWSSDCRSRDSLPNSKVLRDLGGKGERSTKLKVLDPWRREEKPRYLLGKKTPSFYIPSLIYGRCSFPEW
jgi:hypothetical protein